MISTAMLEVASHAFGVEHREHGKTLYVSVCLDRHHAESELAICLDDCAAECRLVTATWEPLTHSEATQ